MDIFSIVIIVIGLCVFEVISSIDNAVINADVLSTMGKKARKWFLLWGMLFAVFVVRGVLPWIIIYASNPSLGLMGALTAAFSSDPSVAQAIEKSAPVLLAAGGTFLVFLFFNWFFLEDKNYGLVGERFAKKQGIWFYAIISIILLALVWFGLQINAFLAIGFVVGSTIFFITHGFKQNAEKAERALINKNGLSDLSKLMYLEIIDLTFSIDGVLGAFAFTLIVPLIIIGNGLGAVIVRELTVRNIDEIKKYKYLKNGAMYSIFFLGVIMIVDSFGLEIPTWLSPLVTFIIIGYFLWKSHISLKEIRVIARKKKGNMSKKRKG